MRRGSGFVLLGSLLLVLCIACVLFPNLLAPYGPKVMFAPWESPSPAHWLGTNDMGYDILTELIYAAGSTLAIAIVAALCSLIIGTIVGLIAGYFEDYRGQLADGVIQIFLLIPMLPMAIVVVAFCGGNNWNIIAIIALLGWCATARTVRTRTMQLKQTGFVEALVILDISRAQILWKHILPNLWEVVLSRYIMSVARCIMLEATLSFLGLGDPTHVTWGRMINLAYKRGGFTRGAYNWLVSPGLCITLLVLSFYCVNHYFEIKNEEVAGTGRGYLE